MQAAMVFFPINLRKRRRRAKQSVQFWKWYDAIASICNIQCSIDLYLMHRFEIHSFKLNFCFFFLCEVHLNLSRLSFVPISNGTGNKFIDKNANEMLYCMQIFDLKIKMIQRSVCQLSYLLNSSNRNRFPTRDRAKKYCAWTVWMRRRNINNKKFHKEKKHSM